MLVILLFRVLPLVTLPAFDPTDITVTVVHSLGKGTVRGRQPWSTESLNPSQTMPEVVAKGRL